MPYLVTNTQMKAAEKLCDSRFISYSKMMQNAGEACAKRVIPLLREGMSICVLCGSGNNGGDGFVIAKELFKAGYSVSVILVSGEPKTDCAKEHFSRLYGVSVLSYSAEPQRCLDCVADSDTAIDCVYGTGFHGTLPPAAAEVIRAANSRPLRIAVDVPSGVNSDTGEADRSCFLPTHTFVLAAVKTGLINLPANDLLGELSLLDIGIPDECYPEYLAKITDGAMRRPFPPHNRSAHKGSFGRLLNIAGSLRYNGAAAMSTKAALRSGVGLCTLAAPLSVVKLLAPSINETTYLPLPETPEGFADGSSINTIAEALPAATAVSIGCGMGNSENTRIITEYVIKNADCPIIIDADGINSISGNIDILKERNRAEVILTPHPLEFSRISGLPVKDILSRRLETVRSFAAEYGVTLVLKGANTVIVSPRGEAYVNLRGNTGLAKGGSGDVLTGIISAMAAQWIDPFTAAASGVYCHALAADILRDRLPRESMLAGDIISALAEVYRSSE